MITIEDKEFHLICSLVYDTAGIHLTEKKRILVTSRLQKLLNTEGFKSFKEYCYYLQSDKSGQAIIDLVDLISTNHTYFNREKKHFDFFSQTVLPEVLAQLKKQRSNDLSIWCAAASTGEEPYMLAMLMLEFLGNNSDAWNAGVLATDISRGVIKTATKGEYAQNQINLLSAQLKYKYFRKLKNGLWAASDLLKKAVTFRNFNLMNKEFPFKKPFQVIFCRNVMIYFDNPTRKALIKKFFQFTEPNGYLFIGHSETLGRGDKLYKHIMPAVYQKIEN